MVIFSKKIWSFQNFCIFALPKQKDLVAQQVEHIPFKDGVLGSNPSWVTKTE